MSVEDRLVQLERENRRLKLAGLLVLAIIGSVFVMGQARPPQNVTASSFTVVNTAGQVVAVLGATEDRGLPFIDLYAPGQNVPSISSRVAYVAYGESASPGQTFRRTAFIPVVSLTQPPAPGANTTMALNFELDVFSRTPRISMTDENGNVPMQMTSRHILLSNTDGVTIWEAP